MWRIKKLYFLSPFILQNILIWVPARTLFRLFARYEIIGRENLKNIGSSAIFATNHSSELDPILVTDTLPFLSKFIPMFYVSAGKELFKSKEVFGWKSIFYGGIFFNALGAYPIYKGTGDFDKALRNHIEILNDGGSLTIFPEGRRNKEIKWEEARPGVAHLLLRTKRPVVPVYIGGSHRTKLWEFFSFRRRYRVVFGEPIHAEDLENQSFEKENLISVSRDIMKRIKKMEEKHA